VNSAIGLVVGLGGLSTLILGPTIGAIADRVGHWRVLFIGAIVSIILWPIPGFMRDLTSFTIAWAILNGTVWSVFALSFSVLSSSATDETRGRVMSFAFLPVNVGSIIGPAIGSVITQSSLFNVFPVAAVFTAIGLGGLVLAYKQHMPAETSAASAES
jgi:ACDE family multidrug resistance protein